MNRLFLHSQIYIAVFFHIFLLADIFRQSDAYRKAYNCLTVELLIVLCFVIQVVKKKFSISVLTVK